MATDFSFVIPKVALIFTTWRDALEREISRTHEAITRFGGHDAASRVNPNCTIFPVAFEPEAINWYISYFCCAAR